MNLHPVTGYDSKDRSYQAYRFKLSDGSYLEVDRILANFYGDPKGFCQEEINLAEKSIKEQVNG